VLHAARMNFPCKYIEELLDMPDLFQGLLNRSGLNCSIEVGGTIRPGDKIVPLDD
jgi:MOSC domain-containing protein YiiM